MPYTGKNAQDVMTRSVKIGKDGRTTVVEKVTKFKPIPDPMGSAPPRAPIPVDVPKGAKKFSV